MNTLKIIKFWLLSIIPIIVTIGIVGYVSIENNKKVKNYENEMNNLTSKKETIKIGKQKDYVSLLERIKKINFLNTSDFSRKRASYIIVFNEIERSIIALDLEIEYLSELQKSRKKITNKKIKLLKEYNELTKSFNFLILPSNTFQMMYEIIGTEKFKNNTDKIYAKINQYTKFLKKNQFTNLKIKELKKLIEKRNSTYSRGKIRIINLIQTEIKNDILKIQNENLMIYTIIGIYCLLLLISIIIQIKSKKEEVDIKGEISNIYKSFEKTIYPKTNEEAKEYLVLIKKEIQKLYKEKEEAKENTKSKSEFLANMSHEIRTPLNGIIGFTELLRGTELNDDQKEFVDIIEKSSGSLLELINNILDLSKIESEKVELESIAFNPIEEFEIAVEVYGQKASQKDINLSLYIDPALNQPIKGDPTKIKEVLINLISNAVKFTPENGYIEVEIKKVPSMTPDTTTIAFFVKDNGIGIAEEAQKTIFEAFQQASSSITRQFGGTGLGLSISYKFINLMGGKLDLESEEGKGTTFSFQLQFQKMKEVNTILENKFKKYNVGMFNTIEENKPQEKNLKRYLKYYGIKVTEIKSINQIKTILKSQNIDLLLIDTELLSNNELIELKEIIKKENIQIPIEFILKAKNQIKIDNLEIPYTKAIFEPLNDSKIKNVILKALQNIKKDDNNEEKEEIKIETKRKSETTKLLVAEDNLINQKLITKTLSQFGLDIDIANNGEEAVLMRKNNVYELIFMDIQMPIMTGIEATKAIREWENENQKERIPIVALTANAIKGDRERFMQEGMDEYTTKPLKKEEIINILNQFLDKEI